MKGLARRDRMNAKFHPLLIRHVFPMPGSSRPIVSVRSETFVLAAQICIKIHADLAILPSSTACGKPDTQMVNLLRHTLLQVKHRPRMYTQLFQHTASRLDWLRSMKFVQAAVIFSCLLPLIECVLTKT